MTATTFACTDFDVAKRLAADASTATYGIRPSDDEVGVEGARIGDLGHHAASLVRYSA